MLPSLRRVSTGPAPTDKEQRICTSEGIASGPCSRSSERLYSSQPPRRPQRRPPLRRSRSSPTEESDGGDFFISPFGDQTTYANGPEILDQQGNPVWFQAVPAGEEASDFRTQTYNDQPVLSWWQGTGLGGLAQGTDYIYNNHYQQIATVKAENGLSADGHEFLITPQNTALILAYTTATADLSKSIGGAPTDQTVIDGVVQEINISTGQGPVPVEQRPITSRTRSPSSRYPRPRARRGTGSTSTPCISTPTTTC